MFKSVQTSSFGRPPTRSSRGFSQHIGPGPADYKASTAFHRRLLCIAHARGLTHETCTHTFTDEHTLTQPTPWTILIQHRVPKPKKRYYYVCPKSARNDLRDILASVLMPACGGGIEHETWALQDRCYVACEGMIT